jgi:hypothetical protein
MTVAKVPTPYDSDKHCGGKKRNGGKCTRPKGWGTNHAGYGNCKLHFGATESNNKAAQLEAANHAALTLGTAVDTNPFDSLMMIEAEARGYVEYFRRQVQALDPDMVYVRPQSVLRRPLDEGKDGENPGVEVEEIREAPAELNICIKAHRQAMEDLRRIAKTNSDAEIAERIVRMQEEQASLYADFARGLVRALGLSLDAKTIPIVQKQLRAIDSTAEEVGND